jgi:quinol monooxygenase YgiN
MVRLTVSLVASSDLEAGRDVEAFRSLMTLTRLEKGCLGCTVRIGENDGATVHYEEEWATEEDLRRRVRSDRFTSVLALLETSREPPLVQFDFVTKTCGLEYVETARSAAR